MASVPLLYRSSQESITWQASVLDWGPAPGMHCIEIQKLGKSGMLRDWVPKYLIHRLSALLVARDADAGAAAVSAKAPIRRTSSSVREGHSGGGSLLPEEPPGWLAACLLAPLRRCSLVEKKARLRQARTQGRT